MAGASEDAQGPLLREYRSTRRASVWIGGAAVTLLIAIAPSDKGLVFDAIACATLLFVTWLIAERPRVRLHARGMAIQGPFRSGWIDRDEVVAAEPGYYGLLITRRHRSPGLAFAIQKPRWAEWLNRSTKADRIAASIERWAQGDEDPT